MSVVHDIILVNEQDEILGAAPKQKTHEQGWLHRAFSVMLYRFQEHQLEFLLQQRAADKYHCGGLWTNTCCSHPRPGELTLDAARRRLREELGLSVELRQLGSFTYRTKFDNGLIEHEYDYVFVAQYPHLPEQFNQEELSALKWMNAQALVQDLRARPGIYTPWLAPVVELCIAALSKT